MWFIMPAFIIRFIVLGEIPGTKLSISFWAMAFIYAALFVTYLILKKQSSVFRVARLINPFFGKNSRLAPVDLVSA